MSDIYLNSELKTRYMSDFVNVLDEYDKLDLGVGDGVLGKLG